LCLLCVEDACSGCSCIEKWLKSAGGGKCPQCNHKAKKSEICVIFAEAVSMEDTTDREEEKALRIQAQRKDHLRLDLHQLIPATTYDISCSGHLRYSSLSI